MKHLVQHAALFLAMASAFTFTPRSVAQSGSDTQSLSSPVAYLYVSSIPGGSSSQINAYSASSDGRLSAIPGSPFNTGSEQIGYMTLNAAHLFGTDGTNIYSFSIASNGSLKQESSVNATQLNPYNSGGPGDLFLDHTGTWLYDGDIYAYGTGSNAYQFFKIDNSTGQLNYLGITPDGGVDAGNILSFIGNNQYAYSSSCYHFGPAIYGYQRQSDGTLTPLSIDPSMPTAPAGIGYCPYLAAADPTNHVAISMTPYREFAQAGPPQIAVYTANSSGNLTTKSTASNMPKAWVGQVFDMWMSPSGKLLAVAGSTGLQVFHFNGGNPATHYTGLLTKDPVDQVFWDNDNHLYAVSRTAGKLFVFTVTPTTHTQAPGSPYAIKGAQNLTVLPKT